jgi:hypothetical protein
MLIAYIRIALDKSNMMFLSTDMVHFNIKVKLVSCGTDLSRKVS